MSSETSSRGIMNCKALGQLRAKVFGKHLLTNKICGQRLRICLNSLIIPGGVTFQVKRLSKLAIHANPSNVALFVYNPICITVLFININITI